MDRLTFAAITVAVTVLSFVNVTGAENPLILDATGILKEVGSVLRGRVVAMTSNEPEFEKPKFCNGLDCPAYKRLNTTKDYELREYVGTKWVSTNLKDIGYDKAVSTMFRRLFNYIEGENEKKEKIAMTCPVITHVIPGQGPACVSNFTMSFFIAPKVTQAPSPSNKDVFLSELPSQKVYVRSFGGRAYEKDWVKAGDELAAALLRDGKKFHSEYFYTAGYDSPFRLLFRHNEVWFMAKD